MLELAARVDQHEVAVDELRVVRPVVQDTRVRARRDDRRIRALRAVAAELVQEFGLELVFLHPGPAGTHGARVRADRDARGLAHHARLRAALEEPHLVQQMIERDELARGVTDFWRFEFRVWMKARASDRTRCRPSSSRRGRCARAAPAGCRRGRRSGTRRRRRTRLRRRRARRAARPIARARDRARGRTSGTRPAGGPGTSTATASGSSKPVR